MISKTFLKNLNVYQTHGILFLGISFRGMTLISYLITNTLNGIRFLK